MVNDLTTTHGNLQEKQDHKTNKHTKHHLINIKMLQFRAAAMESEVQDTVFETAATFLNCDSAGNAEQEPICQFTNFKV